MRTIGNLSMILLMNKLRDQYLFTEIHLKVSNWNLPCRWSSIAPVRRQIWVCRNAGTGFYGDARLTVGTDGDNAVITLWSRWRSEWQAGRAAHGKHAVRQIRKSTLNLKNWTDLIEIFRSACEFNHKKSQKKSLISLISPCQPHTSDSSQNGWPPNLPKFGNTVDCLTEFELKAFLTFETFTQTSRWSHTERDQNICKIQKTRFTRKQLGEHCRCIRPNWFVAVHSAGAWFRLWNSESECEPLMRGSQCEQER